MKEIRWELILMPLVSIVLGIYLDHAAGCRHSCACSLIGWRFCWPVLPIAVNSVTFQRATAL